MTDKRSALQNNGMKLTARGASDGARQLIPVLSRPLERGLGNRTALPANTP
jgi:hypothetical protein